MGADLSQVKRVMGTDKRSEKSITQVLEARAQALEPYLKYLSCEADRALESMVFAIKGRCGAAESAGGKALSGRDGVALKAAIERLGWGENGFCSALLTPSAADPLCGRHLRYLIECIDPVVIITLDEEASEAVVKAFLPELDLSMWSPKNPTDAQGRLLVSVSNFEAALDSEVDKQRAWQQLKQASRSEVLKRF